MKPLSIGMLVGVSLAGFAAGSLIQAILVQSGKHPLLITPWLSVLFLLISVFLLFVGFGIRRLKRKDKTWVTPVLAGRTALFARSSAPISALFAGLLLGIAAVSMMRAWAPMMAQSAWSALAAGIMALIAAVCAVVVERWSVDDDTEQDGRRSDDSSQSRGRASDAASARQSHIQGQGR